MYTEEYERRGFPIRSLAVKIILVVLFALLLIWFLPKLISPTVTTNHSLNKQKSCPTGQTCDLSGLNALTSQIFADNLDKMKQAAISYYTDERLPQEVGASDTMTLSDMIGKKLIIALIDKNNKACDVEKSYVKITKFNDEYILKVNLKDSEKEDYILVHLGCYTYCKDKVCQKQGASTPVKGSKTTSYVPVKGYIERGVYYTPKNPTPVVPVTPTPSNPVCGYRDGNYYGDTGNVVTKDVFLKQCTQPEDRHYCVKYNSKYYDDQGNVVSYEGYKKACVPEEKHICVKYNGRYYDNNGNVVTYEKYRKACIPDEKYICVKHKGKYYDKNGNEVDEVNYIISCKAPKCKIVNGYYFGKKGNRVTKTTFEKECKPAEYLYEYQKITSAKLSQWSAWSNWNRTDCATKEVNCNDSSTSCLSKLQVLKRKEQIGTYEKTYAKQRDVVVQTGSYTQNSCSKYNYVEINKVLYATTTTKTYNQINTITATTRTTTASWTYMGRVVYERVPADTTTKHYKYVGADYSACQATCANGPRYIYDVYSYSGSLTSVQNSLSTETSTHVSSSTATTSSSETIGVDASCGEVVTKTIPIYSTITVTEKAKRNEPLYGDVCYQSTKSRSIVEKGKIYKKWSTFNNKDLLNAGWTYTGNKKQK